MILFDPLWTTLENKKIKQQRLIDAGINRRTLYKLKRNEAVNTETLNTICKILDCNIQDICIYKNIE